ncbi:UvrD-helicase domain-containing protein [Vibrio anguillarum]|uniref:UvrD-helicase domain-containing protein n=2 Tax=Vibrio anguillarum TaxID=55601 RepID=UPI00188CCA69|nr:ATP-dependent helicase [Vibrio anguillarum]MBF4282510.1 ATP-dependent helicase [Vibrio anguillarum]MBF4287273.1 ATP-dependent helicase [Vibrio anguillarum]MBF4357293.1 ATP-dependent helicase [Vibrio anguillarum]MBF4379118.1 ATP-dependent helicase [Vibrio anguillarum]MBF4447440.1 ATP-dependent helicase [Vibrio anguillarum]
MIRVESWQPADGLVLEPNAYRAAKEREYSLALTAGPGAGKTEMLAQRADFLLRTGSCRYPKRILAISFKVDASSNLKERIKRRCGAELSSRFDSYTFHAFAKRIIDRFRPILTGDEALEPGFTIAPKILHKQIDFTDLVPLAIKILKESPVARNALRQTYTDVFLDEFQDCTNSQYELIKVAFQSTDIRLTAVGDTKQKIMGWAGALDGIFEAFKEDFQAVPLNMYRNFRSQPKLLRLQNEIVKILDPASVMPEEQIAGEEGHIQVNPFQNCQEEADYLSEQIQRWIDEESVPPSEIAVLIKNQPELYAMRLMVALRDRGIPYRNEQQLQDITVEPAARLIVDFLLSTFGKQEPSAWVRLMEKLVPFTDDDDEKGELVQNWQRFILEEKKAINQNPIVPENPKRWDCLKRFIEKVGFQELMSLSHDYETESRLREVLNDTCSQIDQLMSTGLDLQASLKRFEDDQAVRILTVHKSKGLEFDSVVLLGVETESYWGNPDENLCAFFVGVSRAKRRLLLTHVGFRSRPAGHYGRWDTQRHRQERFLGCLI